MPFLIPSIPPVASPAIPPVVDPAVASPQTTPVADPAAAAVVPDPTAPVVEPKTRPAYIPESHWDAEKGEVKGEDFAKHLTDLEAKSAALDARLALIPETAEGYALTLPDGLTLPEGSALNEADPRWASARAAAKDVGLTQSEFSKMAGVAIAHEIQSAQEMATYRSEQMTALGPKATERTEAVTTALRGRIGDDLAKHLIPLLIGAKQVEAFEAFLKPGGNVPFSQAGREGGDPTSIAGYENMNFRQRMAAVDAQKAARS